CDVGHEAQAARAGLPFPEHGCTQLEPGLPARRIAHAKFHPECEARVRPVLFHRIDIDLTVLGLYARDPVVMGDGLRGLQSKHPRGFAREAYAATNEIEIEHALMRSTDRLDT